MSATQLFLSIGIPTITILLAWFSNKSDISFLRADINLLRADNTVLRAKIISLRKAICEALIPLHERIAVIEVKQK